MCHNIVSVVARRRGAVGVLPGINIRLIETHSKILDEFGQVQG